jgi:hypothetical protein
MKAELGTNKGLVGGTLMAVNPLTHGTLTVICSSTGWTKTLDFYRECSGCLARNRMLPSLRQSTQALRRFHTRLQLWQQRTRAVYLFGLQRAALPGVGVGGSPAQQISKVVPKHEDRIKPGVCKDRM